MADFSIESTYGLSPLQHGMLFHRLYAPRAGVDIEQIVDALHEELRVSHFRRSWQRAVDHHPALRTTFKWRGLSEPVQQVHRAITVPFEEHDWRGLSTDRQVSRLEEYLDADRHQGFELDKGPLLRLAVFRLGKADYRFVWTFPHAVLDGRSFPMVLEDVFGIYEALGRDVDLQLAARRPYRDYIESLEQHDVAGAESFWRTTLNGFTAPTSLAIDQARAPDSAEGDHGEREIRLSRELTSSLRSVAEANGFTVNTLVQGAWALLLCRYSGEDDVVFGVVRACRRAVEGADSMVGMLINSLPVRVRVPADRPLLPWLKDIRAYDLALRDYEHTPLVTIQGWSDVPRGTPLFESIIVFDRASLNAQLQAKGGSWLNREFSLRERTNYPLTLYAYAEPELLLKVAFDRGRFAEGAVARMLGHLQVLLEGMTTDLTRRLGEIPLLTEVERHQLLVEWNDTALEYPDRSCLHQLVEAQAAASPDTVAVVCRDQQLTYSELNLRANQLAHYLQNLGVRPGVLVGICLGRGIEMMVALLGILKAGGAYVPLDPEYPLDRLRFMLDDAHVRVVLTSQRLQGRLPATSGATIVYVDSGWDAIGRQRTDSPISEVTSEDLAYVIYTSGSTGRPKGVMLSHRNVVNFVTGMDRLLKTDDPGVWLATTSISFDISVLELFWTLARGFQVVIAEDRPSPRAGDTVRAAEAVRKRSDRPLEFSLFYFAATHNGDSPEQRYRLLLEGARYADEHGFRAVWTPERHFHSFGGLYPNPSVTGAAIAVLTQRVQIRAGSVVLPLQHPVRVAEEWAVVDNLSHGRTGISFASGWHADDFVFAPDNYECRRDVMVREIETVRKLWRGESVSYIGGLGNEVGVKIFPQPVQRELPVWVTAAGSPDTFRMAGEIGANLLTHLLGQDIEDLKTKIAIYRKAWQDGGHGRRGEGHVTLMIHTLVGEDTTAVREKAREPFLAYLKTSSDLVRRLAASLNSGQNAEQPSEAEMQALWERAFDRYFETSGLFGSPETCLRMAERLRDAGVDELACLIDFGVDTESVLEGLKLLTLVKDMSNAAGSDAEPESVAALIRKHSVTHMQCTPSMAKMLAMTGDSLEALGTLQTLLLGGEALPASLVEELDRNRPREMFNMYGPTETCIWSTACRLDGAQHAVSIGRPIANTKLYVLDKHGQSVPIGGAGELFIGGAGVARGYLNRPELTAEKFVANPFNGNHSDRLYRTGDLVRYWPDGRLEFLGRLDNQVKVRGHRIELGEIEAVLRQHPAVRDTVVAASQVAGTEQVVAYLVSNNGTPAVRDLRAFLESRLPDYMIPAAFVNLDALPLTPNGKIDRRALPAPNHQRQRGEDTFVAPRSPVEQQLAALWANTLGTPKVGIDDNFFELGGNSLSAVQIAFKIRQVFDVDVPLPTFFHAPTVGGLAREVEAKLLGRNAPASSQTPQPRVSAESVTQPTERQISERAGSTLLRSIVPIQPKGSQRPFFAVHEALGITHLYAPLARHLGPEQPFYGLQAQGGVDGRQPPYYPCTRVEDLASLYLEEVQAIQPEGPYFLGGFCFGGMVAFEMARQLEMQKQRVGLVVLLDTLLDPHEGSPSVHNRVQNHLARISEMRSLETLTYVLGRLNTNLRTEVYDRARRRMRRVAAEALRPTCAALGRPVSDDVIQQCFMAASDRMGEHYLPQRVSTRLLLFRGTDAGSDSTWGWGGLTSEGVEVHCVRADHLRMLSEPAVQQVAEILSRTLREARPRVAR